MDPKNDLVTKSTKIDAEQLYREAESISTLWMANDDDGICLFRGEVIESDSPGSGRSDNPEIKPFIRVDGQIEIRKTLYIEDSTCETAEIGFIAIEDKDNLATLRLQINDVEIFRPPSHISEPESLQYTKLAWSRWYYVNIPRETLRLGQNDICFSSVDGKVGWQLMVADYREFNKGKDEEDSLPTDSHFSVNSGKSWNRERGEYVIRCLLDRHLPAGQLLSRVFDCTDQQNDPVRTEANIESLIFDWNICESAGGDIDFYFRTGSTEILRDDTWSSWEKCERNKLINGPLGRYVQTRAEWKTTDLLNSPKLISVEFKACFCRESHGDYRIAAYRNPQILRSSYEMHFENPATPALQKLRTECELDSVVVGAQTEFEMIQRLHRWAYHIPLNNERSLHTPWDPNEWIDIRRDKDCNILMNKYEKRRRDKMCLYPNVVLAAALQSFGIPARHLNFHSEGMTGHEICEVWSNDHDKWIHLDATRDYYWYDRKTLVPLDTEEIHRVLVERLDDTETWKRPYLFYQDLEKLVENLPIVCWEGDYEHSASSGEQGAYFLFRSFCHFRIIPRFDVFSRQFPIPVSQGTEVWSWNGYLNWAEDKVPPLKHFSNHTNRRADFYPTLNQTRYTATYKKGKKQLVMSLESSTHDFAFFEVRLNRNRWEERPNSWEWDLKKGLNTAEMRSVNGSGQAGVISTLSIVT